MDNSGDTRGLAWQEYRDGKKRETAKGRIVNALVNCNNTPTNYHQLGKLTGLSVNVITRAIYDLRGEGILSHIVKVNTYSGNMARHYFLANNCSQL